MRFIVLDILFFLIKKPLSAMLGTYALEWFDFLIYFLELMVVVILFSIESEIDNFTRIFSILTTSIQESVVSSQ